MKIPVLVPYRPDGGHRDQLWAFLQGNYWSGLSDDYRIFQGVEGTIAASTPAPFNRSVAINRAARRADLQLGQDWEVAVIADADTWVPPAQLNDAVRLARRTGNVVSALTSVIELSEQYTRTLLTAATLCPPSPLSLGVERVRTQELQTQSSMIVVPRPVWETVGGFDEKFISWGGEDNAWWRAVSILAAPPLRIDGAAFHLWHPSTDPVERAQDPQWRANWKRWGDYQRATCECSLRKVRNSI